MNPWVRTIEMLVVSQPNRQHAYRSKHENGEKPRTKRTQTISKHRQRDLDLHHPMFTRDTSGQQACTTLSRIEWVCFSTAVRSADCSGSWQRTSSYPSTKGWTPFERTMLPKVLERTRKLWEKQDHHVGDRHRLFSALAEAIPATTVLYPGSFVDVAPSFVWPEVTYVDVEKRAMEFFSDHDGVAELLAAHGADPSEHAVQFIHGDYTNKLDLPPSSFNLLVSLYAGFISEHCTQHLEIGGHLLVNPSHGDAAMAALDSRYQLSGVIVSSSGRYRVRTDALDSYLVPKREIEITAELLHKTGRGIAYTKSPFAYLFERVS